MRSTKVISISVLPKTLREIDRAATAEQRTRSQFINRAVERVIRADSQTRNPMTNSNSGVIPDRGERHRQQYEQDQVRAKAMREGSNAPVTTHMPNGRPGSKSK
jgi:metal-responsive CopG/Arc/MetJ family transcriptional regulator